MRGKAPFTLSREHCDMASPRSAPMARLVLAAPALAIAACGAPPAEPLGAVAAVTIGSVTLIQRTPLDAAYSIATGRDCSAVRWDRGQSYCRPVEAPPEAPPFCSRTLGRVECWADPASLPNRPRPVAEGPSTLTAAQDAHRTRRWPFY